MVEIPAARPVDGVSNLPAVARDPLELAPHQRLGLSADPTATGQTQSMLASQSEHARQHQERKRQSRLASTSGQHGGRQRDDCQRAA